MMTEATALRLEAKLDLALSKLATLDHLERRMRAIDDMMEVALPMAKVALDGASETLGTLERAGLFTFGKELLRVAGEVMRGYSADDVRRLGDQVVGILDTVRNVTQPDVLALVNDVAGAVHGADEADPKGLFGLMRAGKDPDVRKGFGVMVGILKQVGRAADKIGLHPVKPPPVRLSVYGAEGAERPTWVKHLAPRRRAAEVPPVPEPRALAEAPPHAAAHAVVTEPGSARANLPNGYGLDGFITDPALWTREAATQLADLMSLGLTEAHWAVLTWAREEYATAHASPNIRRISQGANIAVRDLYTLFPGKPGVLIAMLAGIPKPGGCL
jgi:tRNA 2-thiouridine synthesizing protein E